MLVRFFALFALGLAPLALFAQADHSASCQIYAGFASLSNSFNGVPGARQPLLGWQASVAFPAWHHLRPKLDFETFRGTNLGAPQHPYSILAGAEYRPLPGQGEILRRGSLRRCGSEPELGGKRLAGRLRLLFHPLWRRRGYPAQPPFRTSY